MELYISDLTGHIESSHRPADEERLMTSGSLGGVLVSRLARSGRDVGSIPATIPATTEANIWH